MKLLCNVKRIIVPGAAAVVLALQWRAGWFLGSAVTLAAFCFLGIFGPIALGSEKRRKHEKARTTETVLAARMAEFSSEKPADLVEGMMVEGRYALLLRPQLVRNLTVEQRERARAELDKSMALVPEGGVLMAPGVTHPNEDGFIDCVEMVEPLYLDRYQVTNRQFYRFVLAGGYEQFALWEEDVLPALLEFVDETDQLAPRFWREGQYPIELADHPVVGISWYEAEAYARWLGKRLPTDPEWLKAASWPVARLWSRRVSDRFSVWKASAESGVISSAMASAARIVPPWATATMSRPAYACVSRSTTAPTRSTTSAKLSPPGGA